jgi:sulfur-carrier protein adenylyltransferase/sulfurtransferase
MVNDAPSPGSSQESHPFQGFSREEIQRYARHFSLAEVGAQGQGRLKEARVLLVGAGGLGSPAALYLAAAGVGTLGIVDGDRVELSNLQRQTLHGTPDVGRLKVESAVERLQAINPEIQVQPHPYRLTAANALDVIPRYDLVLDGSDNFPTRYLVNDACVLTDRPWVYGAILRWEGQLSVFGAPDGPCYRCLFREPPPPGLVPGCAEAGVVGVLPGIVGSLQALEVIKWILGRREGSMAGRLLIFDALGTSFREITLRRDPGCPLCGDAPTIRELMDYEHFCATGELQAPHEGEEGEVGKGHAVGVASSAQPTPPHGVTGPKPSSDDISVQELAQRLAEGRGPFLLDVREPWEWAVSNLEGHGAYLIPAAELDERLDEVPRDREVVVYCRSGSRSDQAARLLREVGHPRARNLEGGLQAWAREVDPGLPVA